MWKKTREMDRLGEKISNYFSVSVWLPTRSSTPNTTPLVLIIKISCENLLNFFISLSRSRMLMGYDMMLLGWGSFMAALSIPLVMRKIPLHDGTAIHDTIEIDVLNKKKWAYFQRYAFPRKYNEHIALCWCVGREKEKEAELLINFFSKNNGNPALWPFHFFIRACSFPGMALDLNNGLTMKKKKVWRMR